MAIPDEWDGKSVGELGVRRKYGLSIMAIKEVDGLNMLITSDTVLTVDKHILVLGTVKTIKKIFDI